MPLTGKQKKAYQREYMRRKRLGLTGGSNKNPAQSQVANNKSVDFEAKKLVPGEGLEPTSLLRAEDFKSSASANSAIPAWINRILEATSGFEPLNRGFADPCLNHLATSPIIPNGAEDEIRTRDFLLGKEAFYH
jgi:hypothetical protein